MTTPEERIAAAAEVAHRYGSIDGAHHKQWVIDQMLRYILGDGYDAWVERCTLVVDEHGESYYGDWEVGIAP